VAPLASAEVSRQSARVDLERGDVRLRLGGIYCFGVLSVSAAGFLRAALTQAEYVAVQRSQSAQLRWGLGLALQAELAVTNWLLPYVALLADVATSRSDYRVAGVPWTRDPTLLFGAGAGLLLRMELL
jgi:hypothetical protein